ncbi:MAG: YlxR family protein [Ilumatobacteraceae bacterium]
MSQPGDRRVPIRTCIGCRQQHPQTRLVRCVLDASGTIRVDRHGRGRGAWLCGAGCIEPARRNRAFDRAWRTTVVPEAIDRLTTDMTD